MLRWILGALLGTAWLLTAWLGGAGDAGESWRQQLLPWLAEAAPLRDARLRNLGFQDTAVQLVVLWEDGERVYPPTTSMSTWSESTLLLEALPGMNALRQQLPEQGSWLPLYLSSGASWLYCFSPASSQQLCLALDQLALHSAGRAVPEALPLTSDLAPSVHLFAFAGVPIWLSVGLLAALLMLVVQAGYNGWLLRQVRVRGARLLHDLRLPLANIGLYLALQQRGRADDRFGPVLMQEQQRACALADALAESFYPVWHWPRQQRGSLAESDGIARVQQRLDNWRMALEHAGIELDWQPPERGEALERSLSGTGEALERLLDNLFDNACRHAAGGRLYLRLVESDQGLQLRWLTRAGAVSAQPLLRWRRGIGLGSCRWLIRRSGWRCWQQQQGDEFRLRLDLPWVQPAVIGMPQAVCLV